MNNQRKDNLRFRWAASPMVVIASAILVVCWSVTLFVVLIDPLNLYPWGGTPKFRSTDYARGSIAYVLRAIIMDKTTDGFLVGGSTSFGFTRAMIDSAFPDMHNGFNISYPSPGPVDQALVEDMIIDRARGSYPPKRVILALDWFETLSFSLAEMRKQHSAFPFYLYDDDYTNDVRMIGRTTVDLAWETIKSQPLWQPEWDAAIDRTTFAKEFRNFQSRTSIATLADVVRRQRPFVDRPTSNSCADFFTINNQIVPFARSLSAAKVKLDMFFPANPLVLYFDWQNRPDHIRQVGLSLLENEILFRKCLLNALVGIPGTAVFSFDDDVDLVGDLGNYRDTVHAQNDALYRQTLADIAKGEHRLTLSNVDAESVHLRNSVRNYQVYDSLIGIGHAN